MRLQKLCIDGYKKLRNVCIDFTDSSSLLSAHFFVGRNGSGKSSLLEALGLILTRVMHGELPGFNFFLQYQCLFDNAVVMVEPNPERISGDRSTKLLVTINIDGKAPQQLSYLPDQYRLGRIVSYDSGVNGSMEDVLTHSAERALISDMYDEIRREKSGDSLDAIMSYYKRFHANPNAIVLTDEKSQFVLPLLFAFLPLGKNDGGVETVEKYNRMRSQLSQEMTRKIRPITLTLVFDEQRYSREAESNVVFFMTNLLQLKDAAKQEGWVAQKEIKDNNGDSQFEEMWVIPYSTYSDTSVPASYIGCLCDIFNCDPLYCLSVLLNAHQAGVLKKVDVTYKLDGCDELFEIHSLSDGELMWLTRMGLALMAHCKDNMETLFLLDEPDAHFNDDWQIKFVSTLNSIAGIRPEAAKRCEFLVSTHSSLILTDVKYEQLFLFEDGGENSVCVGKAAISSFGALREEISRKIFHTDAIGAHASAELQFILERAQTPLDLMPYLDEVGPGYQRLRVYDRYFELLQE